jgi:hypothetical protein
MNEEGNAYPSRELRWFWREEVSELEKWFNLNGCFFDDQKERHDFYLDIPANSISYKIREGKTEIKMQVEGSSLPFSFGEHRGIAQSWTKWGIKLKKNLTEPDQIYDDSKTRFIELIKKRLLVKFEVHSDGEISKAEDNDYPVEGCQVELTKLEIKGESWFSFAFEAFGSEELINRNFELVTRKTLNQIRNVALKEKDSFSYPVFLRLYF